MSEPTQTNWSDANEHPVCPWCGNDRDLERRGPEWWCPAPTCQRTWKAFNRSDRRLLRVYGIAPLFLLAVAAASVKPVTVRACCTTIAERATIVVTVHTATDPGNARLDVDLEGPEAHWSSVPLHGDQDRATFQLPPYTLPAGAYVVSVALWRRDARGVLHEAGRAVDAFSIGGEP